MILPSQFPPSRKQGYPYVMHTTDNSFSSRFDQSLSLACHQLVLLQLGVRTRQGSHKNTNPVYTRIRPRWICTRRQFVRRLSQPALCLSHLGALFFCLVICLVTGIRRAHKSSVEGNYPRVLCACIALSDVRIYTYSNEPACTRLIAHCPARIDCFRPAHQTSWLRDHKRM